MVKYCKEVEDHISEAISSIPNHETPISIPSLAEEYLVSVGRLRRRLKGTPSRLTHFGANRKLSEAEEYALCGYLNWLDKIGLPVQAGVLQSAANVILTRSHNGDDL